MLRYIFCSSSNCKKRKINKSNNIFLNMAEDYRTHIVSTNQHQVWLHRTHKSCLESILKKGLRVSAGKIESTASQQPSTLEKAEGSYQQTHKGSDVVIVVKLPRELIVGKRPDEYNIAEITYFCPKEKDFYIQRQHVHGWIDKSNGEYQENPYLTKPQRLTKHNFPQMFYGEVDDRATALIEHAVSNKYGQKIHPITGKPIKLKKPQKNMKIIE